MGIQRVEVRGAAPLQPGSCRVVAEAGANHNNDVDRAIQMAQQAAAAGAWAIKFQLYKASALSVVDSPKYWSDDIGTSSQHEAFKLSDHLEYDEYGRVAEACRRLGVVFFATPFDVAAVEALERIDVPLYKIASGDITNKQLLEAVAETRKPLLMSTGASDIDEINRAIDWTGYGPDRLVVLACTLTYPTPDPDADFARLETFRAELDPYLIGFSDHTLGSAGGWMTAALGGVMIEKHFTIDKTLPDVPDHAMSVDADELAELVHACDRAAVLRGSSVIDISESEYPARRLARRSVVLARPARAGDRLDSEDVAMKRPGTGIPPYDLEKVLGRRVIRDLDADHVLTWEDLG